MCGAAGLKTKENASMPGPMLRRPLKNLLALTEIGHWYEVVLLLGLCALFWATNWVGMILIVIMTYLLEILIDNVAARMNWRWMLGYVWSMGLALSIVNLVWLYAR